MQHMSLVRTLALGLATAAALTLAAAADAGAFIGQTLPHAKEALWPILAP